MGTPFLKSIWILVIATLLAGCAMGGAQRWLSAQSNDIEVNGVNYRVDWTPVPDGAFDFRSRESDFGQFVTVMPDPILEQQGNERAVSIVANRLCGGSSSLVSTTNQGAMYFIRMQCGQPAVRR
ncbi:MAG TPA: hypothetical protein VKX28_16905 [Xanthobacteraceae bacterium]|nr:hypothetical protein [Xanthobacteraceae bacterium]